MNNTVLSNQDITHNVSLAKQGDIAAYERLINTSQNLVSAIALAIVKDVDDSEEVAQQVFISVWQNLDKLKNEASFFPWLRQTTRYAAYNFIRDNKLNRKASSDETDAILEQLQDPELHLDEQVFEENKRTILIDFIDQLKEDEREIVILFYREEQSSRHVANLLNITEANVRKKLSRVRQSLKENLLKNASSYIYSSAPALGFSALITSLLVPSSPAAATVAVGGAGASTSSSFLGKIVSIFGGALLGGFMAVIAVFWSSSMASKTLVKVEHKQQMKQYRNETIAWIIAWSLIFAASYSFTDGWIAPTICYLVFAFGLFVLLKRSMSFLHKYSENENKQKMSAKQIAFSQYCLYASIILGFAGLVTGLLASGRLVF